MQLAVVVPAYNSEQWIRDTLGATVRSLHQAAASWSAALEELRWRVIVVDDASRDDTRDAALELGRTDSVEVVSLASNRGNSAATRHGVGLARRWGAQWIATLDDDVLVGPAFFEDPGRRTGARAPSATCDGRRRRPGDERGSAALRRARPPVHPVTSASAIRMFDADLFDPEDRSDRREPPGASLCARASPRPITQHPASVSRFTATSLVAHFRAIARSSLWDLGRNPRRHPSRSPSTPVEVTVRRADRGGRPRNAARAGGVGRNRRGVDRRRLKVGSAILVAGLGPDRWPRRPGGPDAGATPCRRSGAHDRSTGPGRPCARGRQPG